VRRIGLWWVPLLLLAAPALGMMTAPRDVLDYFLPMRALSAEHLPWHDPAWINLANGCGEAWFANPQTGMLYPPHWLYALLPPAWAVTIEVALHLALLSLGVGLLAARWGADVWGRCVAEAAAWSCGPVVVSVGVVNNLDTLCWIPWVVLAALGRGRPAVAWTAVAAALAWLGGEPQIWALGMVLAVGTATVQWRAVAGVGLGMALVAVQLVPFAFWVLEGDRGMAAAASTLDGALSPASWWGLVVPGMVEATGGDFVYSSSLFFGAPLLACGLIGAVKRRWCLLPVVALGVLATLPTLGGGAVYTALTRGLVRYPARFAMVGMACLLPLVGLGVGRWRRGEGNIIAGVVGGLTVVLCLAIARTWPQWLIAALPAMVLVVAAATPRTRWLRDASLVLGVIAAAAAAVPLLGLQAEEETAASPWSEARGPERSYTPPVASGLRGWMATGMTPRQLLQVGYLNLEHGSSSVRTYAPLAHAKLTEHVGAAGRGPAHRWWLDVLGARWVVLQLGHTPEAMLKVRRLGGLWLYRNLGAAPLLTVASRPPSPTRPWKGVGAVVVLTRRTNRVTARVATPREGWTWVSLAPVTGWTWRLDGIEVELEDGAGIVQAVRMPRGCHVLEGVYRPPALRVAMGVSLLALGLVCYLWWPGGPRREENRVFQGEVG